MGEQEQPSSHHCQTQCIHNHMLTCMVTTIPTNHNHKESRCKHLSRRPPKCLRRFHDESVKQENHTRIKTIESHSDRSSGQKGGSYLHPSDRIWNNKYPDCHHRLEDQNPAAKRWLRKDVRVLLVSLALLLALRIVSATINTNIDKAPASKTLELS